VIITWKYLFAQGVTAGAISGKAQRHRGKGRTLFQRKKRILNKKKLCRVGGIHPQGLVDKCQYLDVTSRLLK
jgi:hypothetical protein